MGKRNTREQDGETRILFKKSQHTIYAQSRTCSGVSQINTRSGIMQIKKNLSQHQYYVEGEKVKRDLSMETGICTLRRYYKKKKNRMSAQDGSKSRYSTVNTEIDTIEEFQHDTSAYSNSGITETNNEQYDIPKIMMDNFKYLLKNWIQKCVLDNNDSKDKSKSVMYSLLHRTELDRKSTSSSRSTYVLNRERLSEEVKNKKIETTSIICQYCQNQSVLKNTRANSWKESSCHSTPASNKNIKVISTLSIPKNLHRKSNDTNDTSNYKVMKNKRKNVLLSINKSSKLLDCSSFDLLTISTKSFTRRCATYDCDGKKKRRKKKRHIVFLPKPFYKSATDSTSDEKKHEHRITKKTNLEPMPSLMKSIYADDPANISSTDENSQFFRNDNFTMTDVNDSLPEVVTMKADKVESKAGVYGIETCESMFLQESILNEEDRSDPMLAIDFMSESLVFSRLGQPQIEAICTKTKATDTEKAKIENSKQVKSRKKTSRRVAKFYKAEKKRMKIKNYKKNWRPSQRFLGHCENILQYFADYENKNNMKLDIHITMVPISNLQNKSTGMSTQSLNIYEKSETMVYKIGSTFLDKSKLSNSKSDLKNAHNIIPLLDGADNQSKFILQSGSCSDKTVVSVENNTLTIDRSTITDAEIRNDLKELKSIIKELTKAAEAFVKSHVRKETKPSQCDNYIIRKMENISKGIQFSKEISKHPLLSGIKLSKEPKNIDYDELYHRLIRKSTSYNIIDSESILRVTDMTSAANDINKTNKSLPHSRSMIEVTNNTQKGKLLTYFYDEYNKDFIYNSCEPTPPCQKIWLKVKKNKPCQEPVCVIDSGDIMDLMESDCDMCNQSNIICSDNDDVEKCTYDPAPVCRRLGMGFGEGCFYCMLMWIPIVLIASLLYSYVIKDAIYPQNPALALGLREGVAMRTNESVSLSYEIKLSDLGF